MKYSFPTGKPKLNPNSGQLEGLIAWYPVTKDDTALRIVDHSGRNHDAVGLGTQTVSGTPRGIAADFTAAGAKHYEASIATSSLRSICVRYYGTLDKVNQGVWFLRASNNAIPYQLVANYIDNDKFIIRHQYGTEAVSTTPFESSLDTWIDFVATIDATGVMRLYVNGLLEATSATTNNEAGNEFTFGNWDTSSSNFYTEGFLKDIRIYNKVLTDADAFAYTYPATRYDLWAKKKINRYQAPPVVLVGTVQSPLPVVSGEFQIVTGTVQSPLPIVSGTFLITGGFCIQPIATVSGIVLPGNIGVSNTITQPLPVVSGVASGLNYGVVTQPLPIVSAIITPPNAVTAPLPVVTGTVLPGIVGEAAITTPSPLIFGLLQTGQIIVGSVQAPLSQVNATSGDSAAVQPKVPVVSGVGLVGQVGAGAVRATLAQVAGSLTQTTIFTGDILAPKPFVSGNIAHGTIITGSVKPRISVINALGLNGSISSGTVVVPLAKVSAKFISEMFLTGEVIAPLPTVSGISSSVIANYVAWVLNTENNRATNYTQFPFIALGHMGESPVGATADGIYLLSGDDDNGQAIDSTFKFGMADFRSQLVGVTDVYVGGDIEGDMEIGILEDGQDVENIYTISERERHVRGHHAKLGKGYRARYRQLSISNVSGGDFKLDSFTLPSRDLKGNE
jgi:hypothetical protein